MSVCVALAAVHLPVHALQDEVLSHRLGLVPLLINPNSLAWRTGEDAANESNTVVFKLSVRCSRAADGSMVNDKGEQEQSVIPWCEVPAVDALLSACRALSAV